MLHQPGGVAITVHMRTNISRRRCQAALFGLISMAQLRSDQWVPLSICIAVRGLSCRSPTTASIDVVLSSVPLEGVA